MAITPTAKRVRAPDHIKPGPDGALRLVWYGDLDAGTCQVFIDVESDGKTVQCTPSWIEDDEQDAFGALLEELPSFTWDGDDGPGLSKFLGHSFRDILFSEDGNGITSTIYLRGDRPNELRPVRPGDTIVKIGVGGDSRLEIRRREDVPQYHVNDHRGVLGSKP